MCRGPPSSCHLLLMLEPDMLKGKSPEPEHLPPSPPGTPEGGRGRCHFKMNNQETPHTGRRALNGAAVL